ncbi:MAG: peptidase dimerization domain-containing protein [Clostridia bacterium]
MQPDGYIPVTVRIYGLKGGHSGEDINKKRGNANKLMSRYLFGWYNHCPNTRLVSIDGGVKDNAIPREMYCEAVGAGDLSEEVERGCWWFGEDLAKGIWRHRFPAPRSRWNGRTLPEIRKAGRWSRAAMRIRGGS